jgi:predicted  nucleic acid-binding Zn-ribbon protein
MQIRIGKFEGDKKRLNSKVLELEDQKNDLESQIEDISSELEHERMQRKKIEELYEGS